MTQMAMILSSLLMGGAILLLVWGGREWLKRRFERDVHWMQQAALNFNPDPGDARLRVMVLYGVYVALLVALIFIAPHPLIAVALWLVLLTLPKIVVQKLWAARRRKIDLQLPVAIASLANSIRAGLTLVQAIQRLAETAPEPIRTDFRVMINRYSCGVNLEATIRETKERLHLPNFNLFASALLLNREMGGDIAETLTRISASLDKLHQMRKTVEAHTSEGRTNIKVLLVAPILCLLMLSTADSEGVKMLFTTPQGYAILLIAGALSALGIFFASKITHTEI